MWKKFRQLITFIVGFHGPDHWHNTGPDHDTDKDGPCHGTGAHVYSNAIQHLCKKTRIWTPTRRASNSLQQPRATCGKTFLKSDEDQRVIHASFVQTSAWKPWSVAVIVGSCTSRHFHRDVNQALIAFLPHLLKWGQRCDKRHESQGAKMQQGVQPPRLGVGQRCNLRRDKNWKVG